MARAFSQVWVGMALGALLACLVGDFGNVQAQTSGQPTRAANQLTTGIDCLRKGDIELAATFFQQAKDGEDDLTPAQRQELANRLQYVEMALKAREAGREQLQKAQDAVKGGRTQEALTLLKEVTANPHVRREDRDQAQKLIEQIQPRAVASQPTTSTTGSSDLMRARTMLKNARGLIQKGEFDTAESLAKEAKGLNVVYSPGEDTPQKVLDDVARGRTAKQDSKALLTTARAALTAGDLDKAEKLAKDAEKAESFWQVHLWGDSPSKVLKDVKDARAKVAANKPPVAKDAAKTPAATPTSKDGVAKDSASPADAKVAVSVDVSKTKVTADATVTTKDAKTPTVAADTPKKDVKATVNLPPPPVKETDAARALLRQGRQALQNGKYAEAEKLAVQAKQKNADLNWWDDTPDKLLADIKRAQPATVAQASDKSKTTDKAADKKTDKSSDKTADAKTAQDKTDKAPDSRELLKEGRDQFAHGKLEEAKELALKANNNGVKWGLFEDSPDKLLADVQAARSKRDKDESVRLLGDARKMFDQGKLDEAEKMAYQAERLHGSYSVWDLGDRPHKLVAEIEAERSKNRRTKMPPPPVEVAKADGTVEKITPPVGTGVQAATGQTKTGSPGANTQVTAKLGTPPPLPSGSGVGTQTPNPVTPNTVAQNGSPLMGGGSPLMRSPPPAPDQAPTVAQDFTKQRAKQLLAECRDLQRQGQLIAALQKAREAERVGATFDPSEDNPGRARMELASLAKKQIDNLQQAAKDFASQAAGNPARYGQAETSLNQARELAIAFGLDLYPIDTTLVKLRQMQTPGGMQNPPAGPDSLTRTAGVTDDKHNRGLQLLEQARVELRAGQTETARTIAEEAFSGKEYGVQVEAQALLRDIDAEVFEQGQLLRRRQVDALADAYKRKEYAQVAIIYKQIDQTQLPDDQKQRVKGIMSTPEMQPRQMVQVPSVNGNIKLTNGTAPGSPDAANGASNFVTQVQAMQDIKVQKLHHDGIEVRKQALECFQNGKTTEAIDILQAHKAKVEAAGLEQDRVILLCRPIDSEIQKYRTLKAQKDWEKQLKDKNESVVKGEERRQLAEENKHNEVSRLMSEYKDLLKQGKYDEAVATAMKAHELDPDNTATDAALITARILRNQARMKVKNDHNAGHDVTDFIEAEDLGPVLTGDHPMDLDRRRMEQTRRLRGTDGGTITTGPRKTEKDREIERKLNTPISIDFRDTPLKQALADIEAWKDLNIYTDQPALDEAGISADRPITLKLDQISTKSALNLLLHQVHLTYVIGDEVLKITTEQHARGQLIQKTFPVADLVIPVDNYIVAPCANLMNVIAHDQGDNIRGSPVTSYQSRNSLAGGSQVSSVGSSENQPNDGTNNNANAPQNLKASTRAPGQTDTLHNLLIDLIKHAVAPNTWADVGGKGTIDYFPLGMALVINQTPDVQEQVQDLLDALRRLQDLEVSVEVRMISLEEAFYERIGVDFNVNIPTHNSAAAQSQIVTQQFGTLNTINAPSFNNFLSGLTPAGAGGAGAGALASALTSDLGIPINNSSFQYAIPPFGGYPNIPGANGGISTGIAFLSDIQVFLFMEAAQGDRRTNVMQAPKLTLFNGQTATIQIQDFQWFVTNVQVVQNGGQTVFVPQDQPLPLGVNLAIQAVVSADRRFVRLNIAPTMTNLASATVPLFPITTFITPVFEGGAQGQPVPFTQFIQQPTMTTVTIQTTVSVPDGGTVLLGGLKLMNEGRNEFGPPVLSQIPYINRLFKNVGYGKDTSSLLLMVTPRVIINAEEEFLQTNVDSFGLYGGQAPGAAPR